MFPFFFPVQNLLILLSNSLFWYLQDKITVPGALALNGSELSGNDSVCAHFSYT